MLDFLHIENIAVIEKVDIDFKNGFNVLTGETGAGKSIIIDSIFALMGERTSRELIRHGTDRAVVSASFSGIGKIAEEKICELGFPLQDGNLIVQRTLFADGKGQVRINGLAANVSTLKEVGKYLLNIHGQHDSQNLLNPEKHLSYIDAYAENEDIKLEYLEAFENFRTISKELNSILTDEDEKLRRSEYLKFQIAEIEKADIKLGETEKLKNYIKLSRNSSKLISSLKSTIGAISGEGDDEIFSALDKLKTAKQGLLAVVNELPNAKSVLESLENAILDVESVCFDSKELLDEIQFDPQKAEEYQTRLDSLRGIMLKYGGSEEEVLNSLTKAKRELELIETNEKRKTELEDLLTKAEDRLIQCGNNLTASRKAAAKEISEKICYELSFLDFTSAIFTTDFKEGRYTKNGCDVAEFLISANLGEEPKPLAKIASGGELSRIMLAIRSVLSLRDDVQTLIFDEIDTGISGHAAGKVAVKLYGVAKNKQVICVTHLAQITSFADNHFLIQKSSSDGKTYTNVTPLDENGRVYEIARIISGGEFTDNLLNTAREMLNNKHRGDI